MSKKTRRSFTADQKAAIVRRHLVDKVPVSNLCDEYGIQPSMFYNWQKVLVDQANHFILFQPIYQIAVRQTIGAFPLTAAGWMLDVKDVKPKA